MRVLRRTAGWLFLAAALLRCGQLPFRAFTTADGLVRNTITRIRRDPNGYLWICTNEGLSLFDGAGFTNYTAAEGLPDRAVNDISPLRDGSYAMATGAGLYRFRPRRMLPGMRAQPMFQPIPAAGGVNPGAIAVSMQDSSGYLWAGGKSGLYRKAPDSPVLEPVATEPPRQAVLSLAQDKRGRIWIGTAAGLFEYSDRWQRAEMVYGAREVRAIYEDSLGDLWLGEWGLTHLDVEARPARVMEHLGPRDSPALADRVFGISPGLDGRLWIAGFGLVSFDPTGGGAARFRKIDMGQGWNGYVTALDSDDKGDCWLSVARSGLGALTDSGLTYYGPSDGLQPDGLSGLLTDSPRPIVFGYGPKGYVLYEFNGSGFDRVEPKFPAGLTASWGGGAAMVRSSSGDWWSTANGGLLRFPAAAQVKQLNGASASEIVRAGKDLPDSVTLRLFEDSHRNLWAGTVGGVAIRAADTGRWRAIRSTELVGKSGSVEVMAEDRAGGVWLSVTNGGFARYANGRFEHISLAISDQVNCLFVDSRGRLWLATTRDGLWMLEHPETPSAPLRHYGAAEGLGSSELFAVAEDRAGLIYIAGGHGVDVLNPAAGRARPLAGVRAEVDDIQRDSIGALWFQTGDAVIRYLPRPENKQIAPYPLIHRIRVAGELRMTSDLGETAVSGVVLKPGETGLDINLGAVQFGQEQTVSYQYRFDGDAAWSPPSAAPTISLAGLSSGPYRLLVRTAISGGASVTQTGALSFAVIPFVWDRWWFRLLVCALLASAAVFWHRVRLGRLLEVERIRSRIAADLHDDIGASLSQVAVLSEVTRRRASDAHTVEQNSAKISSVCRELLDSTSDIVWAVDPRHDTLIDLAQRMREFGDGLLAAQDVAFRLDVSPAESRARLGADLRRQLFCIYKEAIHNAARHSGARHVTARLAIDGAWLSLSVEDDGSGAVAAAFPTRSGGHGLDNMRRRAQGLGGTFAAVIGQPGGSRVDVRLRIR